MKTRLLEIDAQGTGQTVGKAKLACANCRRERKSRRKPDWRWAKTVPQVIKRRHVKQISTNNTTSEEVLFDFSSIKEERASYFTS